MFLVKQFMDMTEDANYPLDKVPDKLKEATFQQLLECRYRLKDDACAGRFLGGATVQQHTYDLDKLIGDEISSRFELIESYNHNVGEE